MDGETDITSCSSTDSVFYNRCTRVGQHIGFRQSTVSQAEAEISTKISTKEGKEKEKEEFEERELEGRVVIGRKLLELQLADKAMMLVMDRLQSGCIYCWLIYCEKGVVRESISGAAEQYKHSDCLEAEASRYGSIEYSQWRETVDIGQLAHC